MSRKPEAHEHAWTPVPNETGRYACSMPGCRVMGWRKPGEGIVPYKKRPPRPKDYVAVRAGEGLSHARFGRRGPGSY